MGEKLHIGGLAVTEGVMMRSPEETAVAVRTPNGKIKTKEIDYESWTKKKFWGWPLVRGGVVLIESLYIGMKAMSWAANESVEETEEELSKWELAATIAFSFVFAMALFKFLPLAIASFVPDTNNFLFNLVDGVSKVVLLVAYIWAISLSSEVRRVFQYHGAEHKTIRAYQAGKKLTKKNIMKEQKEHPACGTSFILLVLLISILFYMVIPLNTSFWLKLLIRIGMLPLIAGVSYEIVRLATHHDNWFFRFITYPGIALQYITTREPEEDMIEVAVKAIKKVT